MVYVSECLSRFFLCVCSFFCCFFFCYTYKFYCIRLLIFLCGFTLSSFPFFYNFPLEFFFCVLKAATMISMVFIFPFILWNLRSFFLSSCVEEEAIFSLVNLYLYIFLLVFFNFFTFVIIMPLFWSFLSSFAYNSDLGYVPELDLSLGYFVDFCFSLFLMFNIILFVVLFFLISFAFFGQFSGDALVQCNKFLEKRRLYFCILFLISLFFNAAFFELFFFFSFIMFSFFLFEFVLFSLFILYYYINKS